MSRRHMRRMKALKEGNKHHENEESDEDEEPSVQQSHTFQGLEVSSDSETEERKSTSPTPGSSPMQHQRANVPEEDKYGAKKKTYTKDQLEKKQRKAQKESKKLKKLKVPQGIDEVDWLTEQLNEQLGDPPQRVGELVVDKREQRKSRLFYINPAHLDVNNELAKVYGAKDTKSPHPRNRRASHWIGVSPGILPVRIKGILMSCYKIEERIKFFRFTHNQEYRMRCKALIHEIETSDPGRQVTTLYTTDCVEVYIENSDILYSVEQHSEGRLCLEQCLFCMQFVADPAFSYVDGNTRLLYEFVENRPFHIVLLKYMHVLSNTALHITALALGKVLLSLDPSDPLAVSFIIDTLAIRAREFQWLIDFIEEFRSRLINRLFNMRYSRALALFHIARRTQEGEAEADAALSKAIISYPSVVMQIIDLAKIQLPEDIKEHPLLNPPANYPIPSRDLQQLINLYAWLNAPRWREPFVSNWLKKVLLHTVAEYNFSSDLRERALRNAKLVAQLYLRLPTEIVRHLYILRSMSSYIGGGQMPIMEPTVSFNPYPTRGLSTDTYSYYTSPLSQPPQNNLFMGLFESLFPTNDHGGGQEVAAASHPLDIIDFMNQSNIGIIRLGVDEVDLGNGENTNMLRQDVFYANDYPDMTSLSGPCHELVEVERGLINEDNKYILTEVFQTDEEREMPMFIARLMIFYSIVTLQASRPNDFHPILVERAGRRTHHADVDDDGGRRAGGLDPGLRDAARTQGHGEDADQEDRNAAGELIPSNEELNSEPTIDKAPTFEEPPLE